MHDVMTLHPRRRFVYYGLRAIPISSTFPKSVFQGVQDGHDVQVRADAGSHVDPEDPGQHQIRSEFPLYQYN